MNRAQPATGTLQGELDAVAAAVVEPAGEAGEPSASVAVAAGEVEQAVEGHPGGLTDAPAHESLTASQQTGSLEPAAPEAPDGGSATTPDGSPGASRDAAAESTPDEVAAANPNEPSATPDEIVSAMPDQPAPPPEDGAPGDAGESPEEPDPGVRPEEPDPGVRQ
jgi:hypothetical protein